jgi:predicted RNA-binding Zn ribbon-like protein
MTLCGGHNEPDVAARALSRAITSREMIYRLLLGAVRQQPPDPSDLAAFNRELLEAPARRELIFDGDAYRWRLPAEVDSLDSLLWRLMWSAADLLASDRLAQVKVCAGEGCGWLFLDASRNQSRRWCSMADCGNRAKASRYYRRHQLE